MRVSGACVVKYLFKFIYFIQTSFLNRPEMYTLPPHPIFRMMDSVSGTYRAVNFCIRFCFRSHSLGPPSLRSRIHSLLCRLCTALQDLGCRCICLMTLLGVYERLVILHFCDSSTTSRQHNTASRRKYPERPWP